MKEEVIKAPFHHLLPAEASVPLLFFTLLTAATC